MRSAAAGAEWAPRTKFIPGSIPAHDVAGPHLRTVADYLGMRICQVSVPAKTSRSARTNERRADPLNATTPTTCSGASHEQMEVCY